MWYKWLSKLWCIYCDACVWRWHCKPKMWRWIPCVLHTAEILWRYVDFTSSLKLWLSRITYARVVHTGANIVIYVPGDALTSTSATGPGRHSAVSFQMSMAVLFCIIGMPHDIIQYGRLDLKKSRGTIKQYFDPFAYNSPGREATNAIYKCRHHQW